MAAANNTRAAELLEVAKPYLLKLFENAPAYGTEGIACVFHDGEITRIDVSASVQRKVAPHAAREGGMK
ncbi:hypothetical protein SPIRO4BDMA_40854 [uncultured spirochete]|uniref:Uncharacterized protein n=1 Tax=uncultured spirochete TaxID=156406 RepID=A0A3P3XPQ2_9SPIR|nr:hypothetical protein SPIRO4BDMA_40854 [uncultured spirochete]